MKQALVIGLVGLLAASCSPLQPALVAQRDQPVFEIAVRAVRDGQLENFQARRAEFISWLTAQDGVSSDREFESFYALPSADERPVFIGMTEYASFKSPGKIQKKPGAMTRFPRFAKTMDLQSYVFVQPIEGPPFDLQTLASGEEEILEIGIRRVKPGMEEDFQRYRRAFVELLSSYEGVKESYEFAVVGGKDIDRLTVGMTVYESREASMALAAPIMAEEITQQYFSTFEVVASKFAFSTSNH